MKLERISEYLLTAIVLIVALIVAMYTGSLVGSGNTKTVGLLVGACGLAILGITLKTRIWILIFLAAPLSGPLMFLPGGLKFNEVATLVATFWVLIFIATKQLKAKAKFELVDLVLVINVLWVFFAYLRNPTGSLATGSDRVGGRPYFEVIVALCAYFVLIRATMPLRVARILPILVWVSALLQASIHAITYFFPVTVPVIAKVYGGITATTYNAQSDSALSRGSSDGNSTYRFFGRFGERSVAVFCSYFSLRQLFNPLYFWRFLLLAASLFFILISGARSLIFMTGGAFFITALYRRRLNEVLIASLVGLIGVSLLIGLHGTGMIDLPYSIQRTLSFLPGSWSHAAKSDAQGSTEWRVDMWKVALTTDKYIKNKFLGDGFGFSYSDLQVNQANRTADPEVNKEAFMIVGDFHSGPVSSIRFVGYIGLALYILLVCLNARTAHRLMKASYNTPFFPVALFYGFPAILMLPFFVFVFGAYDDNLCATIYSIGMLHVIKRGFDQYRQEQERQKSLEQALPEKIRISF